MLLLFTHIVCENAIQSFFLNVCVLSLLNVIPYTVILPFPRIKFYPFLKLWCVFFL